MTFRRLALVHVALTAGLAAGAIAARAGMDLLPTFLAAAGLAADRPLDGLNLLPLLGTGQPPARDGMHWMLGPNHAVRRGDWKFVRQDGADFLFDVGRDPAESDNLLDRQPARAVELRALHLAWLQQLPPRLAETAKKAGKSPGKR